MTSMVSQRCLRPHPADRYSSRVPAANKTRRSRPRLSAAKSQPGGPLAAAISAGLNLHRMLTRGRPPAAYGPPRSGPRRCGRPPPRRGTRAPPSRRLDGPRDPRARASARLAHPPCGRRTRPATDGAFGPYAPMQPVRRRRPWTRPAGLPLCRTGAQEAACRPRDRRSPPGRLRQPPVIISGEPSRRSMSATSTARGHLTAADPGQDGGPGAGVTLRAPVATAARPP